MTDPPGGLGRDWEAVFETAASAVGRDVRFGMVYVGPAWESLVGAPVRERARVWKIAVLERRPRAGALHWGHLFLLVGDAASRLDIRSLGGGLGASGQLQSEPIPPIPSLPVQIHVRPTDPASGPRLKEFAVELLRQVDAVVRG